MPSRKFLAKIHITQKEKKVPDEDYRDMLKRLFPAQMEGLETPSSKALTDRQALIFIRSLRDFHKDPYAPSDEQIYLIKDLWHRVYRGNDETKHLRQFLWNHFKVSDVNFLDRRKAYEAVEALKNMQKRRTKDDRRDTQYEKETVHAAPA